MGGVVPGRGWTGLREEVLRAAALPLLSLAGAVAHMAETEWFREVLGLGFVRRRTGVPAPG